MASLVGKGSSATLAAWVAFVQGWNNPVHALTCYCLGHCPPQPVDSANSSLADEEDGEVGSWCLAKPGARCFSAVEQVYDASTASLVPERTYGCLPPDDDGGLLQCKGNLVPHLNPTAIACCSDEDFCNKRLTPMYDTSESDEEEGATDLFGGSGGMGEAASLALLVSLTLCFVLLVVFVTIMYLRFKKREDKEKKSKQRYHRTAMSDPDVGALFGSGGLGSGFGNTLSELIEQSSGSGSGLPLLVQRTIAKQIHMVNPVGKGRYGEVWLAKWRGESVAVKVFFTTDEASWFRETEIYQTVLMRHENILGFIAADIRGTGGCTQMLLITDYHQNGSLYDFLKFDEIDEDQMINLAHSAAAGISHLHTEIQGTRPKPAIAHRDIKSRNILVKRDLTCAIADFGLAVRFDSNSNEVDIGAPNTRVGTTRYMAPEILSQTVNAASFESFKQSDMYSFGLVLWEICRRTRPSSSGSNGPSSSSSTEKIESLTKTSNNSIDKCISEDTTCELPYYEYVGSDPSFDDMQSVVVAKKLRPGASPHWKNNEALSIVYRLMKECWHESPSARLSMLRVKKSLASVKQSMSQHQQLPSSHHLPMDNKMSMPVGPPSTSCSSGEFVKPKMSSVSTSAVSSSSSTSYSPQSPPDKQAKQLQQQQQHLPAVTAADTAVNIVY